MTVVQRYASMLDDSVRLETYAQAMRRVITPESIVLDIGAGTGFFSLLACKYGARHVYAIETNKAIKLLPKQAVDNDYADRITIFQKQSTAVKLPEKADVVISDLRGGSTPLFRRHIATLYDARQRLLKPDGVLMPVSDTLYVALACDPTYYEKHVYPWDVPLYGLKLDAVLRNATNTTKRRVPKAKRIVGEPRVWGQIVYGVTQDPSIHETVSWIIEEDVTLHVISTWFESVIYEDLGYNTSPFTSKENRPASYSGMVLPLEQPLDVQVGDEVSVELWARFIPAKANYTYVWNTTVVKADGSADVHFQQSTFFNEWLGGIPTQM